MTDRLGITAASDRTLCGQGKYSVPDDARIIVGSTFRSHQSLRIGDGMATDDDLCPDEGALPVTGGVDIREQLSGTAPTLGRRVQVIEDNIDAGPLVRQPSRKPGMQAIVARTGGP
jgi:hypothetical protein